MSIFSDVAAIRKDTDALVQNGPQLIESLQACSVKLGAAVAAMQDQNTILAAMAADIKALRAALAPEVVGLQVEHGPPEDKV